MLSYPLQEFNIHQYHISVSLYLCKSVQNNVYVVDPCSKYDPYLKLKYEACNAVGTSS